VDHFRCGQESRRQQRGPAMSALVNVAATVVEPTPVADATFLEPFDTLGYLRLLTSFLFSWPTGSINSRQNTGGQPTTVGAYAATMTSRSR
jgi:hypothetical protein